LGDCITVAILMPVIQSPKLLTSTYDAANAEAYEEGHRARIFFRPSRSSNTTSVDLAEAVGRYTGRSGSVTKPAAFTKGTRTKSESEADLYLFTPDQIRNMPDNRCFLMIDGLRPIYAKKITYYDDKFFTKRMLNTIALPPELTGGSAIYPETQSSGSGLPKVTLPSSLKKSVSDMSVPATLDESNIDVIADQLVKALENASF
jgi:type IV secretory pathway TraG/TraD family ATPase VirD4